MSPFPLIPKKLPHISPLLTLLSLCPVPLTNTLLSVIAALALAGCMSPASSLRQTVGVNVQNASPNAVQTPGSSNEKKTRTPSGLLLPPATIDSAQPASKPAADASPRTSGSNAPQPATSLPPSHFDLRTCPYISL